MASGPRIISPAAPSGGGEVARPSECADQRSRYAYEDDHEKGQRERQRRDALRIAAARVACGEQVEGEPEYDSRCGGSEHREPEQNPLHYKKPPLRRRIIPHHETTITAARHRDQSCCTQVRAIPR